MLASLLPGLRDVRTPLTVGYLWVLILWIWFADNLPREVPAEDGPIRRVFELSGVLGDGAVLAGLSFVAYLLGALLTLPVESGVIGRLLTASPAFSFEARQTAMEYDALQDSIQRRLSAPPFTSLSMAEQDPLRHEIGRAARSGAGNLRPRLLTSNQEMYGEYDRLASEGSFRINLGPPLLALGLTAAWQISWLWAPLTLVVATVLLFQGANRARLANSVLQRAVLTEVITHPAQSILDRAAAELGAPPRRQGNPSEADF
jgi:hypothetical protein